MSDYPCTSVSDGDGGQIPFPPLISQQNLEIPANDFAALDDDVFVVNYPRSGTTWTEQIVHLILNKGEQGEQLLTDIR